MVKIPNPWMNLNSEAPSGSPASDTGAATDRGRSTTAPVPIPKPSMTMEVHEEPPAASTPNPTAAGGTDDIAELLRCAFMPADPAPVHDFPDGFDPHVFMDTLEEILAELDPLPLFLRQRAAE
jgi:hypothetical protein